jgi:hypothetical protein
MFADKVKARDNGLDPYAEAGNLELPRPLKLMLTAGWSLAESAGLPIAAYLLAAWIGGREAGLVAGLAAVPAAIPARQPVHVRAVRPDRTRLASARRPPGSRGRRAMTARYPAPWPGSLLSGCDLALGRDIPAAHHRPGGTDGH